MVVGAVHIKKDSDLQSQHKPSHHHTPDTSHHQNYHHPDSILKADDINTRLYEKVGIPGHLLRDMDEVKSMNAVN